MDIVLARSDFPIIDDVLLNDVKLSNHFLVEFIVSTMPIKKAYKSVTYRDIKPINNEQFCTDVKEVCMNNQSKNMQEMMTNYNYLISEIVDRHAPIKTKQVKIVPNAPWFDLQYKSLRQRRRKSEKKFEMTGLAIHKGECVNLRKETTELANHKKKTFYAQEIDKCNGNSKSLYNCANKLLDLKQDVVLPSHESSKKLAEQFKIYFKEKISDIRE